MPEFRINLSLHTYFQDHRSQSRVFISSEMKTIQDLENHICKLFGIPGDFYLMSNNWYLPRCEDVRILKEGDGVSIVADNRDLAHKKRKRDLNDKENEISSFKSPLKGTTEEFMVKEKKKGKKKDKQRSGDDSNCGFVLDEEGLKEMQEILQPKDVNKNNPKDREFTLGTPNTNYEQKFTLTKPKKKVELLPISTNPRIIQSIVLHNFKPVVSLTETPTTFKNDEEVVTPQTSKPASDIGSTIETEIKAISLENPAEELMDYDITVNKHDETELKIVPSSSQDVNGDASAEKDASELSLSVKKKRHRVRRKKNKSKEVEANGFQESDPVVSVVAKPMPVAQAKHIKFIDDESESASYLASSNVDTEVENILANNVTVEQPKINIRKVAPIQHTEVNSNTKIPLLPEEQILAHPLMDDFFPRAGNIIAFKVIILSESYTPEISKFVIAKVVSYCPEQKQVEFFFIEGGEQCRDPNGKFSLETDEVEIRNKYFWTELIEPRLLLT